MTMVSSIGECRDGRARAGAMVSRGFTGLVMIREEIQVREGMPELPGRLHGARKEKQTQGNETRHSRSGHVTRIPPGNREWQSGSRWRRSQPVE